MKRTSTKASPGARDEALLAAARALAAAPDDARRYGELLEVARRQLAELASLDSVKEPTDARLLLQQEVAARAGSEFLGVSQAADDVRREVELLARSDIRVLILGETGVGKEVVARSIHAQSARSLRPILYVNCAALPEAIAESELFGHTRGAFTGANESRAGKFEAADGGTLFLDEIGELPLSIQPKLLRVLQTGELQRVGSDRTIAVDVRVLSATNRDLEREVSEGRFRADLYHRLSVYPVHVPPLRARDHDVLVLASYFLDGARARLGVPPIQLTPEARAHLLEYEWPGNVRELEHLLERAALRASGLARGGARVVIGPEHLGLGAPAARLARPATPDVGEHTGSPAAASLSDAVDRYKRELVQAAIVGANGNLAEAARALKIDRGNLHRLARRLGVLAPGDDSAA